MKGGKNANNELYRSNAFYTDSEYTSWMGCKYLITAPTGKKVSLRFTTFDTEENYDYVSVCALKKKYNVYLVI